MKRKIISLLIVLSMLFTQIAVLADDIQPMAKPEPFVQAVTEVVANQTGIFGDTSDHWARNDIANLYKKGMVNGVNENEYAPENSITRAEFIKLLVKALGLLAEDSASDYADVTTSDWFYPFIHLAYVNNLLKGLPTSDNNLNPNLPITRQDMALFIYNAFNLSNVSVDGKDEGNIKAFDDYSQIDSYAQKAAAFINAIGIIKGTTETTFSPNDNSTRAQAAVMINRFIGYRNSEYAKMFPITQNESGGVDITLINNSTYPVYNDAFEILADYLYNKMNTPQDTPISAVDDKGNTIITALDNVNGNKVVRFYISLLPNERKVLKLSTATSWTEQNSYVKASWDDAKKTGSVENGIVNVSFDEQGLEFGYVGATKSNIKNLGFTGWLDTKSRGEVVGQAYGLYPVVTKNINNIESASSYVENGVPTMKIIRTFNRERSEGPVYVDKGFPGYLAEPSTAWGESTSITGFEGSSTVSTNVDGASVRFMPYIKAPAKVKVSIYHPISANIPKNPEIEMMMNGNVTKQTFDYSQPVGWITLGTFDFSGNGDEYVKYICKGNTSRTDMVKFENADGGTLVTDVGNYQKEVDEMAKNVKMEESISLIPGQALMKYQIKIINSNDNPVYIAWTQDTGFAGKFTTPVTNAKTPYRGGNEADFSAGKLGAYAPKWNVTQSWISSWKDKEFGIGITTLDTYPMEFYHNKTYWNMDKNQFNLAATADKVGLVPIEIKPKDNDILGQYYTLTLPETSAYIQTGTLFDAVKKKITPSFLKPYSIYVGETNAKKSVVNNLDKDTILNANKWMVSKGQMVKSDDGLELIGNNDFMAKTDVAMLLKRQTIIKLDVDFVSGEAYLVARVPGEENPIMIFKADKPGLYKKDFSSLAGLVSRESTMSPGNIKPFSLELWVKGGSAKIKNFDLNPASLSPLRLIAPANDMELTDFATYFLWAKDFESDTYELQIDSTADFKEPRIENIKSTEKIIYYCPQKPLDIGVWYWRVRAMDKIGNAGQWSEIRKVTVNNDYSKKEITNKPSVDNPLFTFEVQRVKNPIVLKDAIPEDVRKHTALIACGNLVLFGTDDYKEYYRETIASGDTNNYLITTHGPGDIYNWMPLSDIEWIFQHYPNIIGIRTGENHWGLYTTAMTDYVKKAIRLCAKYGKIYWWGDGNGTSFKWEEFFADPNWVPFLKEYGEYMILAPKTNVNKAQYTSHSAVLGAWLSDYVGSIGIWPEPWYWNDAGFGAKMGEYIGPKQGLHGEQPAIYHILPWVQGMAQGAVVYTVDGQVQTAFDDSELTKDVKIISTTGKTSVAFNTYMLPFMRAIISGKFIPTKQEVLNNIKVAVSLPTKVEKIVHNGEYLMYEPLFKGTYGFAEPYNESKHFELFPNTGKYYYIPILPGGVNSISNGAKVVPLSELNTVEKVKEVFDSAYTKNYEGDALVSTVGAKTFIMNTNENQDIKENYSVSFAGQKISKIFGDIEPQMYIVTSQENNQMAILTHAQLKDRDAKINLVCESKPNVTIVPKEADVISNWDDATKTLTIVTNNKNGMVNITLK